MLYSISRKALKAPKHSYSFLKEDFMGYDEKIAELKRYLKSEENLQICKPFIEKGEEFVKIKNNYLTVCKKIYDDLNSKITTREYATESELHRGFYCPSKIFDIVVGNCSRGRLLKKGIPNKKASFEYGFDSSQRLVTVNCLESNIHEIIIYGDNNSALGILFEDDDCGVTVYAVSECLYDDKMRIKDYYYTNFVYDGSLSELEVEKYLYDEIGINTVDYYKYFAAFNKFPCLDHLKYEFKHNKDGYLSSYKATDLSKPKLYDFDNTSTYKIKKKYRF